tara:strand:- start:4568 stop:4951 length:384 start_codon:yes stop_codon:yes gene_type:complete
MNNSIYIRLDVDNVGDNIELALIKDDIVKAQEIHNVIQLGMKKIKDDISSIKNSRILMTGCDDIIFVLPVKNYNNLILKMIKDNFYNFTNYTISIGVDKSLKGALRNLKIAKLSGKNRIIENNNLLE